MATFKEELETVRDQMEVLTAQSNLTDQEADNLKKLSAQALKLESQIIAQDQVAKRKAEQEAERASAMKTAVDAAREEERAKATAAAGRLPYAEAPYQSQYSKTGKYDLLSPIDLSLMIGILKSQGKEVNDNAVKALALRIPELKNNNSDEDRAWIGYVKQAFKAETGIDPDGPTLSAALKTDGDPMYSTGSSIGSNWVGTAYSTELWRAIRADLKVGSKIPERVVADGYSSLIVPIESTDPVWYLVTEATAGNSTLGYPVPTVPSSLPGTSSVTVTLAKIGARVVYTGELTEDSLIAFVPQLREQLQVSGAQILEHVIIDGDNQDCTSVNINDIGGAPAATEVFYAAPVGLRKLGLITNTANSRSAAGALVVEDYLSTLQLMGTAGLGGSDPSKAGFVVDPNTYYKTATLAEVKTMDVFSPATIKDGFVTRMWGYEVTPSWQMHFMSAVRKANTSGKIDQDTTTNNTTGSIVAVRWDQWVQAFKRRMTIETQRIPSADAYEITALIRWGMTYRDTEASAITYNVGV